MTSPFSPEETERYARHLVLPEVGGPGQQKLKAAKVEMIIFILIYSNKK